MKYRTVEVREGELLGPIDWQYNFRQHFEGYSNAKYADAKCEETKNLLKQIESSPHEWKVCLHNFWHELIAVGMYDGWPFWKPTPAFLFSGTLGAEWGFFYDLDAIKRKRNESPIPTALAMKEEEEEENEVQEKAGSN